MPFESFLEVVLGCLRSILKKKTTMTVSDQYEDDFFEIKARETIPEKELNDLKRTIRSKNPKYSNGRKMQSWKEHRYRCAERPMLRT
jgi:hypothetical protein